MPLLSPPEIAARLQKLSTWRLEKTELVCDLQFPDFLAAIAFVNRVASLAERAGHHPDIDIRYNRVRLALVSHDAGGLTETDFALAAEIATVV